MYKRSILILLSIIVIAGLTTSCIFDPKEQKEPGDPPDPVVYKDLTEKDDVLYNLQLAYNERDFVEYQKLLDDNFIFIFSDTDFSSGKTPEQWNRADEVRVNKKIFDPALPGDNLVISLELSLDYAKENWTELPEKPDHPDESWYTKTVVYYLVVKTADKWEHRATGLKAKFTIRWAQTEEGEHWRTVLWRDDVGD